MKTIFTILLLLPILLVDTEIEDEVRTIIHKDFVSEEELAVIIENNYTSTPLLKGYVGLCETMMAEHVFFPTSKLNYFNSGKNKIEDAIEEDPQNYELRYIRMLVQHEAPVFLGYNGDFEEDLEIFVTNGMFDAGNIIWTKIFTKTLLESEDLTDTNRVRLDELLNSLTKQN